MLRPRAALPTTTPFSTAGALNHRRHHVGHLCWSRGCSPDHSLVKGMARDKHNYTHHTHTRYLSVPDFLGWFCNKAYLDWAAAGRALSTERGFSAVQGTKPGYHTCQATPSLPPAAAAPAQTLSSTSYCCVTLSRCCGLGSPIGKWRHQVKRWTEMRQLRQLFNVLFA